MIPEILAPAGSMESLSAALRCGANAVYVGAKSYSARNHAVNFDLHELEQAAQLCHLYHAKLHLAVNTLVTDRELEDFCIFIQQAAQCGIDACIVQDLGILQIIRSIIPEMPLHASTQMSIHSSAGALQAKAAGCCRIVAAREMHQKALAELCRLPIEIEVFVHGALCMSVSGQCSFSSIVGGRSANRGQCAQACRLPWRTPDGSNPAALSLKDLSLVSHVKALQKMGVASFKIEGRMKRPEYVAAAVTALRMALEGQQPDMHQLQAIFSRSGFTDGYFTGQKKNMFGFRTKEDVIASQKILKTMQNLYQHPYKIAKLDFALQLHPDQPALLIASDQEGNHIQVQGDIPEPAQKMPLQMPILQKYMEKLGDSIYLCNHVSLDNPENLTLSAAQCNALRRNAVTAMDAFRIHANTPAYQIQDQLPEFAKQNQHFYGIRRIHVRTKAQMQKALDLTEILCLPVALAKQCDPSLSIYLESPRMIANEIAYAQDLKALYQKGFRHLLCHNLADIYLGKAIGFQLHGGFGLNCTNFRAVEVLKSFGLQDLTGSYELSIRQLLALEHAIPCGAYLYGRLPMMLFRLCPIKAQDGCHHHDCFLTDRTGRKFPLLCTQDYIELYNSEILFPD